MKVTFVAHKVEKAQHAPDAEVAPNAKVAAPAMMSSMRFTANSKKLSLMFAIS